MKNELQTQLSLEESLKDGYRGGRWYSQENISFYAFTPKGPVIKVKIENEDFDIEYFPEFDKIGIRRKTPNLKYFQKQGYQIVPGLRSLSAGSFGSFFDHLDVLLEGIGRYDESLAELFGKQKRKVNLLKRILKRTKISKQIMKQEQENLDREINNFYYNITCGF